MAGIGMKIFEAVSKALEAEKVSTIFGVMGDGNMSLWSTIVARGTATMVSARNEAGAVAMADGFFRATGRVGVATVTCGPGLTQIGTSLMAAARNRTAMVVICGEIPADAVNKLQSMDQRRFVEACSTRYFSITGSSNLAKEIVQAFYVARAQSCPVVLNLPNDIQERDFSAAWQYRSSADLLSDLAPAPSNEDVDMLVDAVRKARKPLIIAGKGARLSGAREEIISLSRRIGALLGTSLQSKSMFSDDEWSIGIVGGYSSAVTEEFCREADLVIGIGAEVGHYTSWGGTLFPQASLIRIDIAQPPVELQAATGRHISADARKTLMRLNAGLEQSQVRHEGFRNAETKARIATRPMPLPAAKDGIDPRALGRALGSLIPHDALLTCGVGHFQGFVATYMELRPETQVEFSSQFGAVGQTLPVAIGIGMAQPDRPHLVIEGDGSLMMNMQELDTAARSKLPMVLLVWNDRGYGAEAQRLPLKGFSPTPAQWETPDFAAVARAVGGDGVLLESLDGLGGAMRRGFAKKGLFVIDARVSPSETSDSYRKLYMGQPNHAPLVA
ncbi:thiamine pyrophosphate-dependent acetolactate synthase large subunit-like protein [Mesorhizobium sp. J18]|uniref:thiamine pyrophosphate-binding protein n=1 Tax=Mesorhizobium sp. J18 TaxID=935263 RepID=UPI00119B62A7|nr:thiamine pyrophosphate-binding protein [Mesorhizobium sp. J18]TWG92816.1 thiamine pyrophosphate-dependent acetolactate synthase large subunit-like protein [Mesorhizobium sp. J18]